MGVQSGRTGFQFLAYTSLALGAAGVVLPLLPTTPFVLLAAFFASKGSPAFARWLDQHPRYGPLIADWRSNRVVPARAKWLACVMMTLSWVTLWALGVSPMVLVVSGIAMTCSASYLLTRPSI